MPLTAVLPAAREATTLPLKNLPLLTCRSRPLKNLGATRRSPAGHEHRFQVLIHLRTRTGGHEVPITVQLLQRPVAGIGLQGPAGSMCT